jgi:hypothetical protein
MKGSDNMFRKVMQCFVAFSLLVVSTPRKYVNSFHRKTLAVSAFLAAATLAAMPAASLATETPTEEKLKTVTTQVSGEGVSIVIAVLAGLAALIAAIIIIPKAIGLIKRFI